MAHPHNLMKLIVEHGSKLEVLGVLVPPLFYFNLNDLALIGTHKSIRELHVYGDLHGLACVAIFSELTNLVFTSDEPLNLIIHNGEKQDMQEWPLTFKEQLTKFRQQLRFFFDTLDLKKDLGDHHRNVS